MGVSVSLLAGKFNISILQLKIYFFWIVIIWKVSQNMSFKVQVFWAILLSKRFSLFIPFCSLFFFFFFSFHLRISSKCETWNIGILVMKKDLCNSAIQKHLWLFLEPPSSHFPKYFTLRQQENKDLALYFNKFVIYKE